MEDALLHLGVGGIFCVMVLKIVFDFLNMQKVKRGNGASVYGKYYTPPMPEQCKECVAMVKTIQQKVDRLYEMHNVKDEEGTYIWYVRRSLEDAIKHLSENIATQTKIFEYILAGMKDDKDDKP